MTITPYATVAEVKANIRTATTAQDPAILAAVRQVSQRIDRMFYRRAAPFFAPYIETRNNYQLDGSRVNSSQGTFQFGNPLLALTGVTVGTQALVVGTNVNLWQSEFGVFDTLALTEPWCHTWYYYARCGSCQAPVYVTIAGTWGYNADYANAWLNTGQTITNAGGIDADDTTFTVTDVDAANTLGFTPAISAGNLLQIDSEWMQVTATNISTNTVTVLRGQNGSTAAAHNQGTAVYAYQVEESVKRATFRQVGLQLAKIGAYENTTIPDLTSVSFPPDVLAEFSTLLTLFAN